ncbi:MAG: caspase family protein [Ignavibacteriae bacterium]|nr:caspase family protein [Ignavibacteriota bacterium]
MKSLKLLFLFLFFYNISNSSNNKFLNTEFFNPYTIEKTDQSKMNIYVVIVGVAKYKYINSLEYTKDDAYRIYAFYKSPEGGAIPDDNISLLIDKDATQENILNNMNTLFSKANSDDMIIFYFSGHGAEGAFMLYDSKENENILKHKKIKEIFQKSKAKYKVCIADACHSGGLKKMKDSKTIIDKYYNSFDKIKGGIALFMSSSEDELSGEFEGIRQGVFSYYIIKGLKGSADDNGDYKVTIKELYNYVQREVNSYTAGKQNPVLNGDYDENLPMSIVLNESVAQLTDVDGNVYKTVNVGLQEWMAENLNVSHYRNGDVIPEVKDLKEWSKLTTGAWCYYKNNSENRKTYGKLYNWYAVNDARGLAPNGWHIPSVSEWSNLIEFLGGYKTAAKKIKSIYGWDKDGNGTDEYGFTVLPAGDRRGDSGYGFYHLGVYGCFWTSTEERGNFATTHGMLSITSEVFRGGYGKNDGFSVRCVKD